MTLIQDDGPLEAAAVIGQTVGNDTQLLLMVPTRCRTLEDGIIANSRGHPISQKLYSGGIASALVMVPTTEVEEIRNFWRHIWYLVPAEEMRPRRIACWVEQMTKTGAGTGNRKTVAQLRASYRTLMFFQ
jgi:hypothetical protein